MVTRTVLKSYLHVHTCTQNDSNTLDLTYRASGASAGYECMRSVITFRPLTLTSSYSKTFVFDRPREYDKSPSVKIYSLESVFKNLRICCRKRHLRVDGRCKRRKKSPFSKTLRIHVYDYHAISHPRRPRGGKKSKRARKISGEDFFFARFFSRLFRLFAAPTNCPWVSEDGDFPNRVFVKHDESKITSDSCVFKIPPA